MDSRSGSEFPSSYSVSICPYELIPKAKQFSRAKKGVLLRIEWEASIVGYADCFPWPEFGDLDLSTQLELLKQKKLTPITQRSLQTAWLDGLARSRGMSLWSGLTSAPNHALCTHTDLLSRQWLQDIADQEFTHIKLKLGASGQQGERETSLLLEHLPEIYKLGLKLRLDFNSRLSSEKVDDFLERFFALGNYGKYCLDFIEDPCPYDPTVWRQIQKKWKVRLALDWIPKDCTLEKGAFYNALYKDTFCVLVLKPAVQDPKAICELANSYQASVVVTSYLDHSFGQLAAAQVAFELAKDGAAKFEVGGLLSQSAYEPHPFSDWIVSEGPYLDIPNGTGLGMDQALLKQPWQDWSSP